PEHCPQISYCCQRQSKCYPRQYSPRPRQQAMRLRPKLPARTASRKCVSSLSPPNVRTPHECYVAVATDGTLDSRRFPRQGIYGGYDNRTTIFYVAFTCGGRSCDARQVENQNQKFSSKAKRSKVGANP